MKKILTVLLFSALLPMCCAAQKIITVNMEKIFKGYYKTPQVENIIQKQAQIYQEYLNKKIEEIKELDKKFRVELDKAQNVTLNSEERTAAAKNAEKLSSDIRVIRTEMESYSNEKRKEMANLTLKKRNELMQEIINVVRTTAQGLGADFVFDVSGNSTHQIPTVIYANPASDITEQILQLLNKGNTPEQRN